MAARTSAIGEDETAPGIAFVDAGAAEAFAEVWRALAREPLEANAFFQPGFLLAAIEHLAGGSVQVAVQSRRGGELAAIAPVRPCRLAGLLPASCIWSHDYGPLGVPLAAADFDTDAAVALVDGLAGGRAALIVPDLPLDGPGAVRLRAAADRSGRPVAVLEQGARAVARRATWRGADGLSRRRRKEFARLKRRLADCGEVTWSRAVTQPDVRARFATFLALEAAGWKGRRGTALASHTNTAQFARRAVFARASDGAVRIDSLDVGGAPAAMVVSFVEGSAMFTWKTAYREELAALSPGAQLMLALPERVFDAEGIDVIDSCADAGHPMIERVWPERQAMGTLVVGRPGPGVGFAAAVAVERFGRRAWRGARAVGRRLRG